MAEPIKLPADEAELRGQIAALAMVADISGLPALAAFITVAQQIVTTELVLDKGSRERLAQKLREAGASLGGAMAALRETTASRKPH